MTDLSTEAQELRDKLAAIEHERWADWQRYMHSKGWGDDNHNLVIPKGLHERWERQINTPYAGLSDNEKASDMEQVDRYWPLLAHHQAIVEIEAKIEIFQKLLDKRTLPESYRRLKQQAEHIANDELWDLQQQLNGNQKEIKRHERAVKH